KELTFTEVEIKAKALSKHNIYVKAYALPKGIFRGVFWDYRHISNTKNNFQLWIIYDIDDKSSKEVYLNIPTPDGFNKRVVR
ncbi:MAG: hypothetical protein OEV42_19895, partial [Deltaproteobacteria bacterium]|nr:hypothetical protein [Deltaproteobacteria bacterium]